MSCPQSLLSSYTHVYLLILYYYYYYYLYSNNNYYYYFLLSFFLCMFYFTCDCSLKGITALVGVRDVRHVTHRNATRSDSEDLDHVNGICLQVRDVNFGLSGFDVDSVPREPRSLDVAIFHLVYRHMSGRRGPADV